MPVDTSMYANPNPPMNPLAMAGQIAGLQGQMQQNQLVQRTMAGQQAEGESAASAVNSDGSFSPDQFAVNMAHKPGGAFSMVHAAQVAQEQRQAIIDQHKGELANAHSQWGLINQSLGSLLQKPNVSAKDVTDSVGTLVQMGALDAKTAAAELAAMPTDAQALPGFLRGHLVSGMNVQQQIEGMIGTPTAVNQGNQIGTYQQPTITGTSMPGAQTQAPLPMSLTPGEAASPVAGPVTNTGAPTTVPLGQRVGMGTVTTGLSPGQSAAQTTSGAGTAQAAMAFEASGRGIPALEANIANLRGLNAQLDTGPGSLGRTHSIAGMQSFLGQLPDAKRVANQEDFEKLAVQFRARLQQSLGMPSTDQSSSIMASASPGSALSRAGNANMLDLAQGDVMHAKAMNQAWSNYKASGQGSETFSHFATVFNKHVDPLAFEFSEMKAPQQRALVDAMSATQRTQFMKSLAFARQNKLIP